MFLIAQWEEISKRCIQASFLKLISHFLDLSLKVLMSLK